MAGRGKVDDGQARLPERRALEAHGAAVVRAAVAERIQGSPKRLFCGILAEYAYDAAHSVVSIYDSFKEKNVTKIATLHQMAEMEYSGDFYAGMEDANLSSARAVVPRVLPYVQATSVLDIGCGQGLWLKAFMEQGITDVLGYDGDYVERDKLVIPKENFIGVDLEQPLKLDRKFDLAISLEVGEHLSDAASRAFVKNLTDAAPVVLFSAAIPGQGGVHHINEQWPDYWERRFAEVGYVPVDCLRKYFWSDKRVSFFYAQNIMFYVKESELSKYPKLAGERSNGHDKALALVHPQVYTYYQSRWTKIAPLIWKVPLPLIKLGNRLISRGVRTKR